MMVGGLGGASFVGLPMIDALRGRDGLGLGLLMDQFGSNLALSTAGVMVASAYATERRTSWRLLTQKVLTMPLFIALVAMTSRSILIEAARPPMIGAGILAVRSRLDAPLARTMIGPGTPLGLPTAPAVWRFGTVAR